jgi:hypothetical protein
MKFKLERIALKPTYTIGKFYIDNVYFCDTLEDTTRDLDKDGIDEVKIFGQTSIPYGTYKVTLVHSPHFDRIVPLLHDVNGFSAVEIHIGNTPKDTLGCILVGKNTIKGQLIESTITFNKLMDTIINSKEEEFTIEIV